MPPLISVFYAKQGKSLLSFNTFCLTVPKNYVETIGCKKKLRVLKKNLHRGISRFSVEKFLSHSTEKLRRRTLLCFKKFLVSKNLCIREGGINKVLSKICCFTVPTKFVGEPICVLENSCYRKRFWIRGGRECYDFPSNNFCFTVPKIFVGEPFSVSLISDLEKFYA